jgi:hypothetical protein
VFMCQELVLVHTRNGDVITVRSSLVSSINAQMSDDDKDDFDDDDDGNDEMMMMMMRVCIYTTSVFLG